QSTLQLRWLKPLLLPPPKFHESILLPRLVDWLIHCSTFASGASTDHWSHLDCRLIFVFPSLRSSLLTHFHGVFSLLFRALDALPRSFESVVVSVATCLNLPLSAAILHVSDPPLSSTLLRLPCSTLYCFHPGSQRLQPKAESQLNLHPTLCKQFLRRVRSNSIRLHAFFCKAFIPPAYAALGPHCLYSSVCPSGC
ncbi:hypothetical protein EDC96DRAFT_453917, partial [Choanephora cucurbitarum]